MFTKRSKRTLLVGSVYGSGFILLCSHLACTGRASSNEVRWGRLKAESSDFSAADRASAARASVNSESPSEIAPLHHDQILLVSGDVPGSPAGASQTPAGPENGNHQGRASSRKPSERRIVIYNAAFRIVVVGIEAAIKQAEAIADESGGWVQQIRGDSITIRVPVVSYQEAVKRVENLGRVAHRELEAADVTEEYTDLEARLRNAQAVRARLRALLAKAEDVKAALEVEKELNRVGEEIERLQAKLELIKNRVAYSTISAAFKRVYRSAPSPQLVKLPFDWLRELDPNRLTRDD